MHKQKVVVGMSGGVDSSVAAYILKQQGYDVIGVTMQIWQDGQLSDGGCCGLSAVDDARRVAEMLDMPYYVMNFRQVFKEKVVRNFIDEYAKGRTPNPCIACNRYVKWESLLQKALALGASCIATGHYARIETHPRTGRRTLALSATAEKDQTYALYNLTQHQLAHTLMPIGAYKKEDIRRIAAGIGLPVAAKPDSQEICFVPDNDYAKFIVETSGRAFPPGDFVDGEGRVLGRHKGIIHYTVGQRKGFGISFGKRMYVKEINAANNQVVLADDCQTYAASLLAGDVNFMAIADLPAPCRAYAKTRYGQAMSPCTVAMHDGRLSFSFDEPHRAVAPGQAAVAYDETGRYVLCGGTIDTVNKPAG